LRTEAAFRMAVDFAEVVDFEEAVDPAAAAVFAVEVAVEAAAVAGSEKQASNLPN
jgi:hypothetical protein